jgi:hypothetical protein
MEREESEPERMLWALKVNKYDFKVFIKKGTVGSHRNKQHPYVKLHAYFNEHYSMRKLIEAIFNTTHRIKWDKNVLKHQVLPCPVGGGSFDATSVSLSYQQHKGLLNFNNRDYLEKYVTFSDLNAGAFYVYFTALPDLGDLENGNEARQFVD